MGPGLEQSAAAAVALAELLIDEPVLCHGTSPPAACRTSELRNHSSSLGLKLEDYESPECSSREAEVR